MWLLKPAVHSPALSQNEHELPVGCYGMSSVKRVIDRLLSGNLKWLTSPAVDKQNLLQMLYTYSGWTVSGTDTESHFRSAHFRQECSISYISNALHPYIVLSQLYNKFDTKLQLVVNCWERERGGGIFKLIFRAFFISQFKMGPHIFICFPVRHLAWLWKNE